MCSRMQIQLLELNPCFLSKGMQSLKFHFLQRVHTLIFQPFHGGRLKSKAFPSFLLVLMNASYSSVVPLSPGVQVHLFILEDKRKNWLKDGSWVLPWKVPSPLQALLLRTVPRSPQSHRCLMWHTCTSPCKSGSLQRAHTQTWFACSEPFHRKKKSHYSACGPALHTELGGSLGRSLTNPKKQNVDRNADKSKAALTPPATATLLCAPALLPRLFSCCDQSTGVSKWSSFSQTK